MLKPSKSLIYHPKVDKHHEKRGHFLSLSSSYSSSSSSSTFVYSLPPLARRCCDSFLSSITLCWTFLPLPLPLPLPLLSLLLILTRRWHNLLLTVILVGKRGESEGLDDLAEEINEVTRRGERKDISCQ